MNLLEKHFIFFDLIAFFVSDCWIIQFDEILNHMSGISEAPIQCVKAASEIYDLTVVIGFLYLHVIEKRHVHHNN